MNRNIVITGGSGGIGQACAKTFLEDGDRVFLGWNHHREPIQALMQTYPGKVFAQQADLSNPPNVHEFAQKALGIFRSVDVLVNNAGFAQSGLFQDMTDEEWMRMWNTHVTGSVLLTRDMVPAMCSQQKGSIINISSMWGLVGGSCEVAYSTAKAALIGFTKALSREIGPMQIRVNCVAPGVIQTAMMEGYSRETKAELAENASPCRLGTAQEVADAVFYLASEKASFVTGTVLSVDGGFI